MRFSLAGVLTPRLRTAGAHARAGSRTIIEVDQRMGSGQAAAQAVAYDFAHIARACRKDLST